MLLGATGQLAPDWSPKAWRLLERAADATHATIALAAETAAYSAYSHPVRAFVRRRQSFSCVRENEGRVTHQAQAKKHGASPLG